MLDTVSSAPSPPTRVAQPPVAVVDSGATARPSAHIAAAPTVGPVGAISVSAPIAVPAATVDVRTTFPGSTAAPDGDARVGTQALIGDEVRSAEASTARRNADLQQAEAQADQQRREREAHFLAGNGRIDDPERPLFESTAAQSSAADEAESAANEDLDDLLIAQTGINSATFAGFSAQEPITAALIAAAALTAEQTGLDVRA
jgi:hypothetical protein